MLFLYALTVFIFVCRLQHSLQFLEINDILYSNSLFNVNDVEFVLLTDLYFVVIMRLEILKFASIK